METQAAQNWISLFGLVLLVVNVVLFFLYLKTTNQIKDASIEQSEGLSKPVVLVQVDHHGLEGLSEMVGNDGESFSQITTSNITLVNVGNGPALTLEWYLEADAKYVPRGAMVYLEPRQPLDTAIPVNVPDRETYKVRCKYKSLSGAEYESIVAISKHDRVTSSSIERTKT